MSSLVCRHLIFTSSTSERDIFVVPAAATAACVLHYNKNHETWADCAESTLSLLNWCVSMVWQDSYTEKRIKKTWYEKGDWRWPRTPRRRRKISVLREREECFHHVFSSHLLSSHTVGSSSCCCCSAVGVETNDSRTFATRRGEKERSNALENYLINDTRERGKKMSEIKVIRGWSFLHFFFFLWCVVCNFFALLRITVGGVRMTRAETVHKFTDLIYIIASSLSRFLYSSQSFFSVSPSFVIYCLALFGFIATSRGGEFAFIQLSNYLWANERGRPRRWSS